MATRGKITIRTLLARKREGERFSMLTCYDYSTARLIEAAGIDSILVGDTYGEVCLGYGSTLPVTLDHLVTVTAGVRRGAPMAYLVGDMPFLSYQVSIEEAIRSAGRFMVEGGCDCVKTEVDRRHLPTVEAITAAGIPVMAHLGLRPQSINQIGGYLAQGKKAPEAKRIIEDAKMMEDAGAVALLLEAVPTEVAGVIAESTALPVIGCVSGPRCDGQVVVLHDMLGYSSGHPPRSIKPYANLHDQLIEAFRAYAADVAQGAFPLAEKSISLDADQWRELSGQLAPHKRTTE